MYVTTHLGVAMGYAARCRRPGSIRACQAGGVKSEAAQILDILDQVMAIVRVGPQDLSWQSRYADEAELVGDLTEHSELIRRGDMSRLPDLKFLFVATGPLCEIAASSGWLATYTELGNRFDRLYERLA